MALLVILGQTLLAAAAGKQDSALSVRITSPLGWWTVQSPSRSGVSSLRRRTLPNVPRIIT